ncbi:MAG: peptidyl-prolyl cis-trans isomerase [Acetobacterales bacterium]
MLTFLRNHSKSWLVLALFGLLILSFGLWGVADVYTPGQMGRDIVAEVGDAEITGSEFSREYQSNLNEFSRTFGQLDGNEFLRRGIAEQALSRLINLAAMRQAADDLGLAGGEEALQRAVRDMPAFQGPDGRYDANVARNVLANSGFSEQQFLHALRGDLIREQLVGSLVGEPPAPSAVAQRLWRHREETRSGTLVRIDPSAVEGVEAPDDAAVRAWYEENRQEFMAPEFRKLTAVVLTREAIAEEIEVSDERLREAFDARAESLGRPERRAVSQILASDRETAERLHARLREGQTFDALKQAAPGLGARVVDLGEVTRAGLPLDELADAVFDLDEGGVSAPVESPLGWHLLHVTGVEPAEEAQFEEVRDELRRELAAEQALDGMFEMANRLEDEVAGGATLEEAARVLDLPTDTVGPVDREGTTPEGDKADVPVGSDLLQEAWNLQQGGLSGLLEGGTDTFYMVRVDEVTPPAQQPLEAVRAEVERAVLEHRRMEAARQRAEALRERAAGGAALDSLGAGDTVSLGPVTRDAGEGTAEPAVLSALFDMDQGETRVVETPDGFVLLELASVTPPTEAANADALAQIRNALRQQIAANLGVEFNNALRERYRANVNQQLFNAIVSPDAGAPAGF